MFCLEAWAMCCTSTLGSDVIQPCQLILQRLDLEGSIGMKHSHCNGYFSSIINYDQIYHFGIPNIAKKLLKSSFAIIPLT